MENDGKNNCKYKKVNRELIAKNFHERGGTIKR